MHEMGSGSWVIGHEMRHPFRASPNHSLTFINQPNMSLILASASPRRQALLQQLGLAFMVHPSHIDETTPPHIHTPAALVEHLALEKAKAVAASFPNALTLGADTIVVLDGQTLGKPATPTEAEDMLAQLSNRTHLVYTGLGLVHPATDRAISAHETTAVTFADLSPEEISTYVASGAPMDKAGAYGIQDDLGAVFVSSIQGDYYNVVGLPLHRFYQIIKHTFSDLRIF